MHTHAQKQFSTQKRETSSTASLFDSSSKSESLQRKADMVYNASQRAEAPRPNNTGMPDNLKSGIESLSGFSMDDVRVHYNSSKPATVQALAYTQGTDIHVAPGQEKHLPHEAWHVAQQMAGRVSPTTNINGMLVNDNASLEHEADVMGEKAVQCTERGQSLSYKSGCIESVMQCLTVQIGNDFSRRHIAKGKSFQVISNERKARERDFKCDLNSFVDEEKLIQNLHKLNNLPDLETKLSSPEKGEIIAGNYIRHNCVFPKYPVCNYYFLTDEVREETAPLFFRYDWNSKPAVDDIAVPFHIGSDKDIKNPLEISDVKLETAYPADNVSIPETPTKSTTSSKATRKDPPKKCEPGANGNIFDVLRVEEPDTQNNIRPIRRKNPKKTRNKNQNQTNNPSNDTLSVEPSDKSIGCCDRLTSYFSQIFIFLKKLSPFS